jgi:hypothetical protein
VVLTFDDGPCGGRTPAVLAALAAKSGDVLRSASTRYRKSSSRWPPNAPSAHLVAGLVKIAAEAKDRVERASVPCAQLAAVAPFFRLQLRHPPR